MEVSIRSYPFIAAHKPSLGVTRSHGLLPEVAVTAPVGRPLTALQCSCPTPGNSLPPIPVDAHFRQEFLRSPGPVGHRCVLPVETLCKIHQGHQGILRCCLQVMSSLWMLGVSTQMEELVKKCPTCMHPSPPIREPIIPSPLPTYPWGKVATDLFEFQGQN